jgi:hypothetical protein
MQVVDLMRNTGALKTTVTTRSVGEQDERTHVVGENAKKLNDNEGKLIISLFRRQSVGVIRCPSRGLVLLFTANA